MDQKRGAILRMLKGIFDDAFLEKDYEFSIDLSSDDIEEWNSLSQIRLLLAIESEFGFSFDVNQLEGLNSVRALTEAIVNNTESD